VPHPKPARQRVPAWLAGAVAVAAVLAACSGTASPRHPSARGTAPVRLASAAADVSITPANGGTAVAPNKGITVVARHGRLEGVSVRGPGRPVTGVLGDGGTRWHSTWALGVSSHYTVTARVRTGGQTLTRTASFTTLTPRQTFQTQIFEGYRQTYGVGMPIELTFNRPITNKAAVERALQVATSKPVVGAWYWDGDEHVDFRPRSYWPVGTWVSFVGHLNGVEGAPGVYGFHTLTQSFHIGRSVIVTASTRTHHMNLYVGGRLRFHWPISTGRPGDNTPNGTYLTIEKGNPVDMKGPGYNLEVPWSVRITFSGDYLHDAYWSVGEQGFTNVSHGCVNMPPADAEIYYKMAVPGDPVTITGSPRGGTWDNGWTEWFLSWAQLVRGSALHEAVVAGPTGSRFVNPATLPPAQARAPLQTAARNNAAA
jgi:lipoprotein-anchoring transpeptidase ErfK/SrfK